MSQKSLLLSIISSLVLHLGIFFLFVLPKNTFSSGVKKKSFVSVKITQKKTKKKEVKKKIKKKPKIKKIIKSKISKKKVKIEKEPEAEKVEKEQILSSEGEASLSSSGNREDFSSDAELVNFEKPEYTDEALDYDLEGTFVINVYVASNGTVLKADLERAIGFGMDERILEAALNAKFAPRRNSYGRYLSTWTQIVIRLEIP